VSPRAVPGAVPCAASSLLGDLLDASSSRLVEVARTRVSVHYETGDERVPVICVATPDAVRLPASLLSPVLPSGPVTLGDGALQGTRTWRVTRWWQPPRPRGLTPPRWVDSVARIGLDKLDHPGTSLDQPGARLDHPDGLVPADLVGRGPGLTPSGDDVLAGGLVAAHATGDLRLARWRSQTLAVLDRTTAVSRGLLRQAADGWATPELADFVVDACTGSRPGAGARLLAVGHSSGAALATGVRHVLSTHPTALEGAA
jgi:uncharacterized protein DUF2877